MRCARAHPAPRQFDLTRPKAFSARTSLAHSLTFPRSNVVEAETRTAGISTLASWYARRCAGGFGRIGASCSGGWARNRGERGICSAERISTGVGRGTFPIRWDEHVLARPRRELPTLVRPKAGRPQLYRLPDGMARDGCARDGGGDGCERGARAYARREFGQPQELDARSARPIQPWCVCCH